MKQSLRIAILAASLVSGLAHGATTAAQQLQTVNLALTATVQARSTATSATFTNASVATKDVLAALGKALNQTFSSKAQLVLISNAASTATNLMFYVRDTVGKTNVLTPVNDYLSMNTLGAVTKTTISNGHPTSGPQYEVNALEIQTPTLNLSLYSYGTQTPATGALSASGVGSGTVGANQALFKGTLSLSSLTAQ
ncbi:MAG TPA: hypothetical protein VN829_16390 [Dongiaceae bacterium]|nr:hypothetical protein [Dongiaceae bacterium]